MASYSTERRPMGRDATRDILVGVYHRARPSEQVSGDSHRDSSGGAPVPRVPDILYLQTSDDNTLWFSQSVSCLSSVVTCVMW